MRMDGPRSKLYPRSLRTLSFPPIFSFFSWIAVSAHLRPGHSGGPLVDHAGRLVGINTMMAGPNVGLAVPVEDAKGYLQQALGSPSDGRRASVMV